MAELKRFTSKSLCVNSVVVDGKTEFNYAGRNAVCTKAELQDDGSVKAYVTIFDIVTAAQAAPGLELKLFQVNSMPSVVDDVVLVLTDVTMTEEVKEDAVPEDTETVTILSMPEETTEDSDEPAEVVTEDLDVTNMNMIRVDRGDTDIRN